MYYYVFFVPTDLLANCHVCEDQFLTSIMTRVESMI